MTVTAQADVVTVHVMMLAFRISSMSVWYYTLVLQVFFCLAHQFYQLFILQLYPIIISVSLSNQYQ